MTIAPHLLDDELLIIENGGEMPEVTLHGCLHFLNKDPEGPQCTFADQDLHRLRQAVVEGYRKIIIRDLTLANRGKGHYRGLARSVVNWQRLSRYCRREGFDPSRVAAEVCNLLERFVAVEHAEVRRGERASCINCSTTELLALCEEVGLDPARLPEGWQGLIHHRE
jgi:hypothetical protein